MRTTQLFDRDEAAELLPKDHEEDVIAAENLTLSTVPYNVIVNEGLDEADRKKQSAIERVEEKKKEMLRRQKLAELGYIDSSKKCSPASERAAETYKLNRLGAGVSGPGSSTVPSAVSALMKDIGVNLELKFSRQDTYDLMSVLLTCSESQLEAMMENRRMPVMVKSIIKAILDDYKNGRISTVEKLWNRLFGPSLSEQLSQPAQGGTTINVLSVVPGIGSGTRPISREGYALIRDKVFGPDADAEEVND